MDLRLPKLVRGVNHGQVLIALANLRVHLVLGRHLLAVRIASAGLKLHAQNIELLLCQLLLQCRDLLLGLQLGDRMPGTSLPIQCFELCILSVMQCLGSIRHGLPAFGRPVPIEEWQRNLDPQGILVRRNMAVAE